MPKFCEIDLQATLPAWAHSHDAVIMGRAGGLEMHIRVFAKFVKPVQKHLRILLRGNYLVSNFPCRARLAQAKNNMPGAGARVLAQVKDIFKAGQD